MTENEIAKQVMDVTFLVLLKHGFKRVVNGLLGAIKKSRGGVAALRETFSSSTQRRSVKI